MILGSGGLLNDPNNKKDPSSSSSSWEIYRFSDNVKRDGSSYGSKSNDERLLIAQYTAPGMYSKMLDETSPINKAYAEMYGHDYVIYRGIYLSQRRWIDRIFYFYGNNEKLLPKPSRSTFNKIIILEYAINNNYDRVLLLDADAMIYDFSQDFIYNITLFPTINNNNNNIMLNALMAHPHIKEYKTDTWNVNIGVTLWNLHHPFLKQKKLIPIWKYISNIYIQLGIDCDQAPLHWILKFIMYYQRRSIVYAHRDLLFGSYEGILIKHYIRRTTTWDDDDDNNNNNTEYRMRKIKQSVQEICNNNDNYTLPNKTSICNHYFT